MLNRRTLPAAVIVMEGRMADICRRTANTLAPGVIARFSRLVLVWLVAAEMRVTALTALIAWYFAVALDLAFAVRDMMNVRMLRTFLWGIALHTDS